MGWVGVTNGGLLNRAEAERFDVMVTGDQNLTFQQNLKGRRIAIVVLDTNNWKISGFDRSWLFELSMQRRREAFER